VEKAELSVLSIALFSQKIPRIKARRSSGGSRPSAKGGPA